MGGILAAMYAWRLLHHGREIGRIHSNRDDVPEIAAWLVASHLPTISLDQVTLVALGQGAIG